MALDADFLSRWSRRKAMARAAQRGRAPAPGSAASASGSAVSSSPSAVTAAGSSGVAASPASVTGIDGLQGLASDYSSFLGPEINESLKRAALRKLFADPHFNVMDGLDVYVEDFSKSEPLSAAVVETLNSFGFLRSAAGCDAAEAAGAAEAAAAPEAAAAAPSQGAGVIAQAAGAVESAGVPQESGNGPNEDPEAL